MAGLCEGGNEPPGSLKAMVELRYSCQVPLEQANDTESYEVSVQHMGSYRVPLDEEPTTTTDSSRNFLDAPVRPRCPQGERYHKPSGRCKKVFTNRSGRNVDYDDLDEGFVDS
ncbi:hypothetical protein ANN_05305 [Periplaneta americana]|uniref:Uncharacterized protein n=1 Tax=Periplaneta americana TaxID=6978 RepID=A0ABQ8TC25_PERAM|nr:hypothetical protein ANN_05305 [Periplaneta americana]